MGFLCDTGIINIDNLLETCNTSAMAIYTNDNQALHKALGAQIVLLMDYFPIIWPHNGLLYPS